MGKPYMPLMMGDWIRGTRAMRAQVKGVYIGLLIHQYDNGFLPADIDTLSLIEPEVGSVWVLLKDKFTEVSPGMLQNEKLEEVRNFWNKQANNGKKGGRPKTQNPKPNPNENPKHNHHNDLDYSFNNEIAKILNKKYEAGPERGMQGIGQDVDSLIIQMRTSKMNSDQIMNQAKSMRSFYEVKDWPMPTNYIKLLSALLENDWPQKLKDEDPEKRSERITKSLKDASRKQPEPDTIGSSAPGSLG